MQLQQIQSRQQMIRFFDGYSTERMEELDERKLRRPLVKTHLLELRDEGDGNISDGFRTILGRCGISLKPLDESLSLVIDSKNGEIGFLERLRSRIVAIYSILDSKSLESWVRHLVLHNHEIDHVWLSGQTFGVLWQLVAKLSKPSRFTRMVFTHDSIFDIDKRSSEQTEDTEDDEQSQDAGNEELEEVYERRATSFRLVDRIEVIQKKLEKLQDIYSPLYAISQLRFPSPVGRGGHDFYDSGHITNRSNSFRDHRSHVIFFVRIYEKLIQSTEEQAWYSIQDSIGVPGQFRKIVGAPVVINFHEKLTQEVFNQWISATFERKLNKFRLWGHPIRLGPRKVHVYGVDRHLWQPLFLELTAEGCKAIIPNGTCGNTLHRLVTNIQRYLDPGAKVFIGDKPYTQMVEESASGITYESDTES